MIWNQREHKDVLEKLEQKFSDEKLRLQQEANKKIEEIAERAQDEALKYRISPFHHSLPITFLSLEL
jgi:vacuolar-type H+-ATPase subunit H